MSFVGGKHYYLMGYVDTPRGTITGLSLSQVRAGVATVGATVGDAWARKNELLETKLNPLKTNIDKM